MIVPERQPGISELNGREGTNNRMPFSPRPVKSFRGARATKAARLCGQPGCAGFRCGRNSFLADCVADADGLGRTGWQVLDEAAQVVAARMVLQLAERLGFDLADAFARDLEDSACFFERIAVAVAQAVTELDDLAFAV